MAADSPDVHPSTRPPLLPSSSRMVADLFLISLLILFLELACIRWFPAHVLFLTFFTNTVLLACFLGMSVGCLAASYRRSYLKWTPVLLGLAMASSYYIEQKLARYFEVGDRTTPQVVFFGSEFRTKDVAQFAIPIEAILAFFFVILALAFVGPGQELGRALTRVPSRLQAYTVNIFGSVVGIALFASLSWLRLSPFWWFLPVALGLAYFLVPRPHEARPLTLWGVNAFLLLVILLASDYHSGAQARWRFGWAPVWLLRAIDTVSPGAYDPEAERKEYFWSPYYRIDYSPAGSHSPLNIAVNLISHQQMLSREDTHKPGFAYALSHLLNRDTGGKRYENVLIIGAGSGNDVSRAIQWGAGHIDAVEIDPVIQSLGKRDHPDRPYDDPRVTVHLDDGRNFLRSCGAKKYDLVIYALVDSLVLHSSYSNLRLESYLFTEQAFRDVQRVLKPDGTFAMYNYFRQAWIVARLRAELEAVFGNDNPLVLPLPFDPDNRLIVPDERLAGLGYALFLSGNTAPVRDAFRQHPIYWLANDRPPSPVSPNGFTVKAEDQDKWQPIGLAEFAGPSAMLRTATDDWPFLYVRNPMIPTLVSRGMAIMGALALALIFLLLPRSKATGSCWTFDGRMFFLGAGFMLIETKAVVHMALLFGGTWVVNSVVFFAVLVMILMANLFVLKVRPGNLGPYYVGLFMTLALNVLVPLDAFLGLPQALQVVGACLLVFAPILFAGVIFAVSFARTAEPDRAFGANIAGAMLGGLAENSSMLLGFQYLVLVALAFYLLSAVLGRRRQAGEKTVEGVSGPLLQSR